MALPKAPVPRPAPRTSASPAVLRARRLLEADLEDEDVEELEAAPEVAAIPRSTRLTLDGVPLARLQLDFGKDRACFVPKGSVIERFWDQYDDDEPPKRCSRPPLLKFADIKVKTTDAGFLAVTMKFPRELGETRDPPLVKLVITDAVMAYELQ